MGELGQYLMIGLAVGGLAIGSGIFRGMSLIGRSIVRAAKIDSMARNNKYFTESAEYNGA
jgi:hypothetical protein